MGTARTGRADGADIGRADGADNYEPSVISSTSPLSPKHLSCVLSVEAAAARHGAAWRGVDNVLGELPRG